MSEKWADDCEVNYVSFDEDEDPIDIKYKKLKHQETRNKFTEFLTWIYIFIVFYIYNYLYFNL